MTIHITSGKGYGKTPLSAFDAALKDANVHNFNLIMLSSIIPPGSIVKVRKYEQDVEQHGNRLYIVKAEMRSRESGKYIGAALGWYQIDDGRGIFVEHEEIGETKESVESNLEKEVRSSLSDLCRFRNYPILEKKMNIRKNVMKVTDSPGSVVVIAVFKSEKW